MTLLDLQVMKPTGGMPAGGKGGGSTLTVLTCGSVSPSGLSVALCH